MTLLAPWFALAGLLGAAAIVAAHFIGARARAPASLPTTRFVPRLQERSAALERRPRDVLLMLLRAAALVITGVALAAPIVPPRDRPTVKIVIADVAGSAGANGILERARVTAGDHGRVVISGSGVAVLDAAQVGGSPGNVGATVSLTAALMQALREAAALGTAGHPVELAIASEFRRHVVDSATAAVRALWPGSVELVEVATTPMQESPRGAMTFRGEDDDPLRATVSLLPSGSGSPVSIVRGELFAADSASAAGGAVVVHWPRAGVPDSFTASESDTVGGVWIPGYTLVAPFPRNALFSGSGEDRVVARWVDGLPAAVERENGDGCVRRVAIVVPDIGDLSISPGFQRVAESLTGPCGEGRTSLPLAAAERATLQGRGSREALFRPASTSLGRSPLTVPLLLVALVVLLVELGVRRWRS
ncbi:MAG TPA: BatA domain-containing protein [Gemmatimonadaceae bacterium]|nr:BatA domain-containing protein [Gemmatimonadaceae bacterium]